MLRFQKLQHRGVGEGTTPFHGLLHFILDPYLIMLSVKQGGIKYHFWVFGMTRAGIEPRSTGPLSQWLDKKRLKIEKTLKDGKKSSE